MHIVWCCRYLALRAGEKLIDQLDSVEDTKGNNGERGTMLCFCWAVCLLRFWNFTVYTLWFSCLCAVVYLNLNLMN